MTELERVGLGEFREVFEELTTDLLEFVLVKILGLLLPLVADIEARESIPPPAGDAFATGARLPPCLMIPAFISPMFLSAALIPLVLAAAALAAWSAALVALIPTPEAKPPAKESPKSMYCRFWSSSLLTAI